MKNYHLRTLIFPALISFVILLGMNACKPPSDKILPIDDGATKKVANIPGGNYSYLYCTVQEFNALKTFPASPPPKREGRGSLMLKYNIADSGLTMHGWTYKYHQDTIFTPSPNLQLLIGKDTAVSYKVGSYLGDFVVSNADIIKVKRFILNNPGCSHVVFVPHYSSYSNFQIEYDIYLSSSAPQPLMPQPSMMVNTDAEGRPIPPGGGKALEE